MTSQNQPTEKQIHLTQVRLLLEELCCELCQFERLKADGNCSARVKIDREYYLGKSGMYADIRVAPEGSLPYIIEVKFGYSDDALLRHLKRKYSEITPAMESISKVVLVIDSEGRLDWSEFKSSLAGCFASGLKLEIWNEARLIQMLKDQFHIEMDVIDSSHLVEARQAIDRALGFCAFGGDSLETYDHEPLKAELLWHLGSWKIRKLREKNQLHPSDILPPGLYRGVAILLADLCSFSSYVRDTQDERIVRECLTSFYSKARYQIINGGGMLYQFVGDEVVGLFGVPDQEGDFARSALETAEALVSIGHSVSNHWQRQIDRMQESSGVHIGVSVGDIQIVSMRPFGRTRVGAVGDCINVAARLMGFAKSGEVVASNSFVHHLDDATRARFEELEPVEAKNVGRIKAWKLYTAQQRFLDRES
jgi:class 3 adenylate cyclase